jgi:hypothetical protein
VRRSRVKYSDATYDFRETDALGDFQCDLSGGYPVILFYSLERNIAWLEPTSVWSEESPEYVDALCACIKYGVWHVENNDDVNEILNDIGGDATDWLLPDDYEM